MCIPNNWRGCVLLGITICLTCIACAQVTMYVYARITINWDMVASHSWVWCGFGTLLASASLIFLFVGVNRRPTWLVLLHFFFIVFIQLASWISGELLDWRKWWQEDGMNFGATKEQLRVMYLVSSIWHATAVAWSLLGAELLIVVLILLRRSLDVLETTAKPCRSWEFMRVRSSTPKRPQTIASLLTEHDAAELDKKRNDSIVSAAGGSVGSRKMSEKKTRDNAFRAMSSKRKKSSLSLKHHYRQHQYQRKSLNRPPLQNAFPNYLTPIPYSAGAGPQKHFLFDVPDVVEEKSMLRPNRANSVPYKNCDNAGGASAQSAKFNISTSLQTFIQAPPNTKLTYISPPETVPRASYPQTPQKDHYYQHLTPGVTNNNNNDATASYRVISLHEEQMDAHGKPLKHHTPDNVVHLRIPTKRRLSYAENML